MYTNKYLQGVTLHSSAYQERVCQGTAARCPYITCAEPQRRRTIVHSRRQQAPSNSIQSRGAQQELAKCPFRAISRGILASHFKKTSPRGKSPPLPAVVAPPQAGLRPVRPMCVPPLRRLYDLWAKSSIRSSLLVVREGTVGCGWKGCACH